jgi:hypothetical protein
LRFEDQRGGLLGLGQHRAAALVKGLAHIGDAETPA